MCRCCAMQGCFDFTYDDGKCHYATCRSCCFCGSERGFQAVCGCCDSFHFGRGGLRAYYSPGPRPGESGRRFLLRKAAFAGAYALLVVCVNALLFARVIGDYHGNGAEAARTAEGKNAARAVALGVAAASG